MKKTYLLLAATVLSISACNPQADSQQTESQQTESQQTESNSAENTSTHHRQDSSTSTNSSSTNSNIVELSAEDSNNNTLAMTFDNAADTVTVSLNQGEKIKMTSQRPASGIWYANKHYDFSGKGEHYRLQQGDKILFEN